MHLFYFIKGKMHTLDNYTLKGYALNHMPVGNWKKETNGGPSVLFNTTKVFNAKTHSHSASALDPAEVNFRLHRIQTPWSSNSGKHLFTFYCSSFSLLRGWVLPCTNFTCYYPKARIHIYMFVQSIFSISVSWLPKRCLHLTGKFLSSSFKKHML